MVESVGLQILLSENSRRWFESNCRFQMLKKLKQKYKNYRLRKRLHPIKIAEITTSYLAIKTPLYSEVGKHYILVRFEDGTDGVYRLVKLELTEGGWCFFVYRFRRRATEKDKDLPRYC